MTPEPENNALISQRSAWMESKQKLQVTNDCRWNGSVHLYEHLQPAWYTRRQAPFALGN